MVVYDITKDFDGDGELDGCEEWDAACKYYNNVQDNDEPVRPSEEVFDELRGYQKARELCRQMATIATLDVFLSHDVQSYVDALPTPEKSNVLGSFKLNGFSEPLVKQGKL